MPIFKIIGKKIITSILVAILLAVLLGALFARASSFYGVALVIFSYTMVACLELGILASFGIDWLMKRQTDKSRWVRVAIFTLSYAAAGFIASILTVLIMGLGNPIDNPVGMIRIGFGVSPFGMSAAIIFGILDRVLWRNHV